MVHRVGRALGIVALALVSAGGVVVARAEHHAGYARRAPAHAALSSASSVHLALGTPVDADPSDDEVMVRPEYALSYNRARNAANWVSWELNASYLGSVLRHRGGFLSDDALPAGWYRVRHEDYTGSLYDRGHVLSSEDRTRTPVANLATFRLTNVLPQRHELNVGPWLRLEEYCHALAAKEGRELYVMAGGIFAAHPPTIGRGVSVPDAFFKIVVVLSPGEAAGDVRESTRVIAVIMPNTAELPQASWAAYRTTVNEVERRTGYDFLTRVPAPIQRVIERRVDRGPSR
jgi:endonuclease G